MKKPVYGRNVTTLLIRAVDKYGMDYCQHFPVRHCCYMECKNCKKIAEERRKSSGNHK